MTKFNNHAAANVNPVFEKFQAAVISKKESKALKGGSDKEIIIEDLTDF